MLRASPDAARQGAIAFAGFAPCSAPEPQESRIRPARYERHAPERTLLYRLVRDHYPAFTEQLAIEGRPLPRHVRQEFEEYLRRGRLEHGFLRVRCERCHAERLVAFSCAV